MNQYGFPGGNPVTFTDPFGLCPNPPCFTVEGSPAFQTRWAQLVAHSPTLASFVGEASNSDRPQFVLQETSISTLSTYGSAGGYTLTLDNNGREVDPSKTPVVNIISKVSTTDLQNRTARGIMLAGGKVPTLQNVMVHEFAHGVLAGQRYQSNEQQANKVECKIMSEVPGGRCQ
jgi:hypothetical protein